ncbi:MAG TPA: isocitrate/isopropylmalate family dehydrogenase [Planctomycetota bacterium]
MPARRETSPDAAAAAAPARPTGEGCAVYEAIHGTALDIAGKGIANPIALTLSAAMMCHDLGHADAYRRIRRGIAAVTQKRRAELTPDLGGSGTCASVTEAIIQEMRALPPV